MFLHRKEQGFIIRRNRQIESQSDRRSRFLSHSQLPVTRHQRSPGSIRKIIFKEDTGIIKSKQWGLLDSEDNPQFSIIKYNIGWQDKDDESLQQPEKTLNGVRVQTALHLHQIMKSLKLSVQNRSSSDILSHLRHYFQFINKKNIIDLNDLTLPSFSKKTLKESMLYERIGMMIVAFVEAFELFSMHKRQIMSIVNYSLDNMLVSVGLLTKGESKEINEVLENEKKNVKKGFEKMKNKNQAMSEIILKIAKHDNLLAENLKKFIKIQKGIQPDEQFRTILQYFAFFLATCQKEEKLPFLSVAPSPFLPPSQSSKYTLVINVMDVCYHKNRKSTLIFRPFSEYFLAEMSKFYQIVSLCHAMPNEANKYIEPLDKKGYINHKLYRYHLDKTKSLSGKDLSKLGRKMDEVISIDTSHQYNRNTIIVSSWKGKKNDAELAELCSLLAMIAVKKVNTVKAVKKIRQKIDENRKLGLKYLNCGFDLC